MGGCEVASAAAPMYYCDSSYFPVWRFGGKKKKKKIRGWGQRGWGGGGRRERRPGGGLRVARGCRLSPSSPQGCQACEPGERNAVSCSFTLGYLEGPRRSGGGSHTPPSGGVRTTAAGTACLVTPARALTGLAFFFAKLPLSFLPPKGEWNSLCYFLYS